MTLVLTLGMRFQIEWELASEIAEQRGKDSMRWFHCWMCADIRNERIQYFQHATPQTSPSARILHHRSTHHPLHNMSANPQKHVVLFTYESWGKLSHFVPHHSSRSHIVLQAIWDRWQLLLLGLWIRNRYMLLSLLPLDCSNVFKLSFRGISLPRIVPIWI